MTTSWRVKLDQASKHLTRLEAEVADYIEGAQARFSFEYEAPGHTVAVRVVADHEPPLGIGATVGDVVHNLNSALEAVAWEAVTRADPTPPSQGRWVGFPITSTPAAFHKRLHGARNPLPGLAVDQLKVFESLQPWFYDEQAKAVLGADWVKKRDYGDHGLGLLRRLWNVDKHQTIHPVLARGGIAYVGVPEGIDLRWSRVDPPPWGPGRVMFRWHLPEDVAFDQLSPAGEVLLALSEEDAQWEQSLQRSLGNLAQTAGHAVNIVESNVLGGR
jgi:hypothetical protein